MIWKSIPGFDGLYEVNETGLIRSIRRSGSVGKEIKQHLVKGYLQVWLSQKNKIKKLSVHRAVLMAFDRMPKDEEVCNHKDGNRINNKIANLEWCSRLENEAHKKNALGQDGRGEKNSHFGYRSAKLYPSPALRNRLCALGVPRHRHNLAELGEMLPIWTECIKTDAELTWQIVDDSREQFAKTEADARAKMLIHLIESKLINIKVEA